jgi:hypothetical protein
MDLACSKHGEVGKCMHIIGAKLKGNDKLEDLDIYGKIILKRMC